MAQTLEQTGTATETSPVNIRKLGHVVFRVRDVERSTRFYTEILNFRELANKPASEGTARSHFAKMRELLGQEHAGQGNSASIRKSNRPE